MYSAGGEDQRERVWFDGCQHGLRGYGDSRAMSRCPEKVVTATWVTAFLTAAVIAGAPARSDNAPGNSGAATESIVIGGSVSNSTITNTINNQDPAALAAMAKTFADQMAATMEAKAQAEAKAAE